MDENTLTNPAKWGALIGLGDLPENPLGPIERKGCCAALYDTQAVRMLLGDSLHPGGLALTNRLSKLVDIKADDMVLDLACGSGASAIAIARAFHCRVVGVDLGAQSIAEAASTARNSRDGKRVGFLRGDGEQLPLVGESFDAVVSECSMSLFPDKKTGRGRGVAATAARRQAGRQRRHGRAWNTSRRAERHIGADTMCGGRPTDGGLPKAVQRRRADTHP